MNELNVIATARYIDAINVPHICEQWKLSNEESKALKFLVEFRDTDTKPNFSELIRAVLLGQRTLKEAELALLYVGDAKGYAALLEYDWPIFPINGNDIVAGGVKPGPLVGKYLAYLKSLWAESDYTMTREELLSIDFNC